MKLSDLQPNPNNPRIIKDERFLKLKENIERYPKFLEKRPIVIDSFENPVILGGNMRYRALKELGYKELPKEWIKEAKDFTEEEKRAFVIIDNIEYGEEDWEALANDWSTEDLEKWGLEIKGVGEVVGNFDDPGIQAKNQFGVIVVCGNDTEQEKIFKELTNLGYSCKVVVT